MSQNLFIGPFQTGLERDKEPFLLTQDAFVDLEDAYVWRGRVVKKSGYTFLGRLHETPALPELLGATAGPGTFFTNPVANPPISPGTLEITVGALQFSDNGNGTLSETTGAATVNYGIVNYESGQVSLYMDPGVGGGVNVNATDYRTLTRDPVMGLGLYERPEINRERLIAHDVDNSYIYNTGTGLFDIINTAGSSWFGNNQWTSSDSDFVWTTNYYVDAAGNKLHWATNNIAYNTNFQDGIQYYDGTNWITLQAQINGTPTYLRGALIVIPYRDRLVALNTLEGPAPAGGGATRYANRARWSQNGTPVIAVDANAWREDIIGKGGYIDAPTGEAIVSAAFYKDTLVVFFERSTWRLRYTANQLLPFVWEQINSDLGAESTFSPIVFDKGILAVGDKRIVSADATNVEPIDQKIPDEVYNFHNDNEGPKRIHGIRDYYKQLVYWTFPNDDPNETFPDKMLVLNYIEGSYAIYNDSFTCFGTFQKTEDYTWATLPYESWSEWNKAWGDPLGQSFFPNIIGGNQKGFVEILDTASTNDQSLDLVNTVGVPSITNAAPAVFGLPNHNLKVGEFIKFKWTRAFAINVAGEAVGTAVAGSTVFRGTLDNLGLFTGTLLITLGALTYQDLGDGTLLETTGGALTGTINYETGDFTINFGALGADTAVTADYDYNILNFRVFKVASTTANTFQISRVVEDGPDEPINFDTFGAPYTGTGEISIVNNFKAKTKRFSPFLKEDAAVRSSYADIFIKETAGSFITECLSDQDDSVSVNTLTVSSSDEIQNGLNPTKLWKRVFLNTTSNFIQLQFKMSEYQLTQRENFEADWELHGINMKVFPAGRQIGGS